MPKKKLLHVIPSLGRGGAETLLVNVTRALTEFDHLIVTFDPANHFEAAEINAQVICLHLPSVGHYPKAVFRLRKLIGKHGPDLVHTHLYWPTVIARLAVPRSIPLVSTVHAFISGAPEYRKTYIRLLDRYSFRRRPSLLLAVAEGALQEYLSMLRASSTDTRVLHTFVDPAFFSLEPVGVNADAASFPMVSVGALREQKNQRLLLEALHQLREEPVTLDMFGSGPLQESLLQQLHQFPAKVTLKGEVRNIRSLLPGYSLFVMSSAYEGFSIAVLEAMALRIPLLLSDIPSFREQCGDTAVYFEPGNASDCARKIRVLMADAATLKRNSDAAYQRVKELYTMEQHLRGIRAVYHECLD